MSTTEFPRPPRDEEEREACGNGARGGAFCGASAWLDGPKCTRAIHAAGKHVQGTGGGQVLAAWTDGAAPCGCEHPADYNGLLSARAGCPCSGDCPCIAEDEPDAPPPPVTTVNVHDAADEAVRAIGEDRQGNVLHAFLRAVAAYPEALAAGLAAVEEERR